MEERDKEAADTPKDDLPLELEQNPLSQQPDPYDWYDEFRVERWDGFRFSEQQRNAKPERKAFVKGKLHISLLDAKNALSTQSGPRKSLARLILMTLRRIRSGNG